MAKHDALKENLFNFYTSNRHLNRKEIFDRFIAIGAPERSLNRWLCNLEQNKTLKRKKGSGRIAKKATPKVIKAKRSKSRKLLNKYRDYNFIIDDESYFTLSHTT
jgi:hypothetical protein